jgi:hypothetical protein
MQPQLGLPPCPGPAPADTRALPVGMTNRRAVNGRYAAIYRKWHLNVDMFRNSDRD